MGNADLRSLAALSECPFENIEGSTVAVDAHNWLYRYLTTTVKWTDDAVYTTADGTEVANLVGVIQGLPKFFEHGLTPIFVFDGGVTELKDDEVEKRREQRKKAEKRLEEAENAGNALEAARLSARTVRLTETIQETTRELLDLLDVPYIDAPAEGEAQASYMNRVGDVDFVGSEDYDTLLFGAPRTLRGLTSKGHPELMELEPTLTTHDLTYEQLVDVALLCGTDFNEGIRGIGPKTGVKLIKKHGDLFGVLEARDEHIPFADRIRELFFNPSVTTEYTVGGSITPDLVAARAYVIEDWEVDESEVDRGFERIEQSVVQTGLDRWS